jgi:hypothetical protein
MSGFMKLIIEEEPSLGAGQVSVLQGFVEPIDQESKGCAVE